MENGASCLSKSDKVRGNSDFPQMLKNMELFLYFILAFFKDWHSLWQVICILYLQAGTKGNLQCK